MITLVKEGATGILTAGTLLAGTGASLTSTTDIDANRVETVSGDLNFAAGGDVTVHNPLAATDVAIDAGGTITTGAISARDDIALRAGNTLNVGTLTSGVAIGGTGPVDTAGAADALLGANLAGHDLFVQGGTVTLTQAAANGTNSDLTVRATTGGLSITNGSAGGTITLTKEGTSGILSAGTLSAGTGATLTSATDIDAQTVQTASGDLAFSAGRDVTVHNPLAADDVAIDAGRNITTGRHQRARRHRDSSPAVRSIPARSRAASRSAAQGRSTPAGAADTCSNETLAGHDLSVQAGHVSLADATANGTGSDLTVRATNGDLSITTASRRHDHARQGRELGHAERRNADRWDGRIADLVDGHRCRQCPERQRRRRFRCSARRDARNGAGAEWERQHPRRRSRHPRRHYRRAGLDHQPQRRKCGDGAWRRLGARRLHAHRSGAEPDQRADRQHRLARPEPAGRQCRVR